MKRPNSQDGKAATYATEARLREGLEKRLLVYAMGAGAAGALASPPAAMAEIVFTPTNVSISSYAEMGVPITIDGTTEFKLIASHLNLTNLKLARLYAHAGSGAAVVATSFGFYPAALKRGSVIGPKDQFGNRGFMALADSSTFFPRISGQFANTNDRYLGLKFTLHGQTHYGWARFSTVKATIFPSPVQVGAIFAGYAFETVPDKPIYAGQTRDSSSDSRLLPPNDGAETATLQTPSLGLLALGSPGLNAWRKKEALEAQPSEARTAGLVI